MGLHRQVNKTFCQIENKTDGFIIAGEIKKVKRSGYRIQLSGGGWKAAGAILKRHIRNTLV